MPSLRQILARHAPVLLIDAASARVQAGWLTGGDSARWETSDDEAGVGIFRCVEALGADPGEAGGFVFCDGPGSVLGVRTTAMALRVWHELRPRPMFAYHSLSVVAVALNRPDATVIADARRDRWHCASGAGPLRRVATADLVGELVMPEGFRHWTPLPAGVERTPYALAELLPRVAELDLFRPADAPDAFLHEEPSYATWSPKIHRAPAPGASSTTPEPTANHRSAAQRPS
jgi:tRNA threonylcarbamoyladenosine biosynthesis protein TsaB